MADPTIEADRLPRTAAIDTGVFLRGVLGERAGEPDAAICRAFCNAMIDAGRTLFVPTPSLAEICRHTGARPPRRRGIVLVPFDGPAAEALGLQMPQAKLHEASAATGWSRTYLKFDSMIVACAVRSGADMFVALDGDHTAMASGLIEVRHPEHFRGPPDLLELMEALAARAAARDAEDKG